MAIRAFPDWSVVHPAFAGKPAEIRRGNGSRGRLPVYYTLDGTRPGSPPVVTTAPVLVVTFYFGDLVSTAVRNIKRQMLAAKGIRVCNETLSQYNVQVYKYKFPASTFRHAARTEVQVPQAAAEEEMTPSFFYAAMVSQGSVQYTSLPLGALGPDTLFLKIT